MADGGTALGLMVAAAGAWSAGLAAFALRRAVRQLPDGLPRRRLVLAVPIVYAAASIVGFGVGLALADGSAGRRLGLGFVGMAMSWLLLWFVILVVLVGRAVWATAHYAERVRPISLPDEPGPR